MAAPWYAALDGYKKQSDAGKRVRKQEYDRNYDKKIRKRAFQITWTNNRPWLRDSDEGMLCNYCTELGFKNSFTTGCTLRKLDSIVKHEQSSLHKRATDVVVNKAKPVSSTPAGQAIATLNKATFEKLVVLFRTCHALVMNNRPLTDYEWITELDEAKGLDVGKTYRNNKSASLFVHAIAQTEYEKLSKAIRESLFLCLIGDGSTDAAVKEQEMWYLRTCVAGNVKVYFVGVFNADKASAENLVTGLKEIIHKNLKIDWPDLVYKLVGLACDGASVMTGCRNGVGALLRKDAENLQTIHCMAHRLELALKDLAKSNKLYSRTIDTLLLGLYLFYHNSSLNRAMLRRSFDALRTDGGPQTLLLPTKVGGTRWISHTLRAVTNCITSYQYIIAHLEQLTEPTERVSIDAKSKAKAFLKFLKARDTVMFLHFMLDVLQPVKKLSMTLQSRSAVLATQHSQLSLTMTVIEKFKHSDGPNLRKVTGGDNTFTDLKGNCDNFNAARRQLIDKILHALEKRFSEFSSPGVVSATRICDIHQWPKSWESLKDFGDNDLNILLKHYGSTFQRAGVDVEEAEYEWTGLKKELLDMLPPTLTDWVSINDTFISRFPNILKVMDLIMTLSPSSAEAERGFSQLKLIKTRLRTRLNQDTLNNLLCVKLESPAIKEFNPTEAIHLWNEGGIRSRRPIFMDKRKTILRSVEGERQYVEGERECESVDVRMSESVEGERECESVDVRMSESVEGERECESVDVRMSESVEGERECESVDVRMSESVEGERECESVDVRMSESVEGERQSESVDVRMSESVEGERQSESVDVRISESVSERSVFLNELDSEESESESESESDLSEDGESVFTRIKELEIEYENEL